MSAPRLPKRLELWPLERLVPYARNPRTHSAEQIEKLAASIAEYGFTSPILVADAGILAGHGRLKAAQQLGLTEVPVIDLSHLSDAQRRAYVIADNRLALDAGWDEQLLTEELGALKDEGFDLALTGFEADELAELLEDGTGLNAAAEEGAPPVPASPVTVAGDLWLLGPHRLLCGDSTMLDQVERLTGGELVACLWTDPPYNVAYEGTAGSIANDSLDASAFRELLLAAFRNAYTVLQPGGPAYVAHADTEGLAFRQAFIDAGFKLASCLIWRKNALVLGRSDYHWQHEPILYGWREGAAHAWYGARDKTTIAELPGELFAQIADDAWQISLGEQTLVIRGQGLTVERVHGSVFFEEKPTRSAEHPTMKPVALIERMLANSTRRGDPVLDLFGGSGSTLIAAHKSGRRARLMELDPRFVDVIVKRWQEYTGQPGILEGSRGRTFEAIASEGRTPKRARARKAAA